MAEIINSPIVLDSTGQSILSKLRMQNGLLSILAEEDRQHFYSDISTLAYVVRNNDLATLKQMFSIGDQIVVPWKDMDDSAHNTDETAYQVAWDFLDIREVTKKDGSVVPGLVLGMHKCSASAIPFSAKEAFYCVTSKLAAGTYYITFGSTLWYAEEDISWEFTLTQDVPKGGWLSGFDVYSTSPGNWTVESWNATPTLIESVSVREGVGGTMLGTMYTSRNERSELNCIGCTAQGHNRWKRSAIRQYLNGSGTDWWTSGEDYWDFNFNDFPTNGFMTGFGADFLSAIKPVKVITAVNSDEGGGECDETYDTFFLPNVTEINARDDNDGTSYFPYWRERLGLNRFAGLYGNNTYSGYKIPAINREQSYMIWLRTPSMTNYHGMYAIHSDGCVGDYGTALSKRHFVPVCVIC